jgi:hypothetical protein
MFASNYYSKFILMRLNLRLFFRQMHFDQSSFDRFWAGLFHFKHQDINCQSHFTLRFIYIGSFCGEMPNSTSNTKFLQRP